jgi:hypothetical protein
LPANNSKIGGGQEGILLPCIRVIYVISDSPLRHSLYVECFNLWKTEMQRIFLVLFLIHAAPWMSPADAAENSFEFVSKNCQSIGEPREQIARCLAIIDKVELRYKPGIYTNISIAYDRLGDLDSAIDYQTRAAKTSLANPPDVKKLTAERRQMVLSAAKVADSEILRD